MFMLKRNNEVRIDSVAQLFPSFKRQVNLAQ